MSIVEFLTLALATWRTSSLLSEEDGPCEILEKFRQAVGVRYDENEYAYGQNEMATTLSCIWCLSPWVGFFWALLQLFKRRLAFWLALPFAFSAVALILHGRGIRYRKMR